MEDGNMLNEKDAAFIAQLRLNSRQTLTEISKQTGIPISTLFDRLKSNEKTIILRYTTLIDFARLGLNCRVNVLMKARKDDKEQLISYLKAHPAVNNLFRVNNGFDMMAECIFKDIVCFEGFMEELDNKFEIEEKQTNYVICDLKREEFELK
jgi:DNA-binding Lrp family transcriptional regulator